MIDHNIEAIPLNMIDEGSRARIDYGDVSSLADSIKEKGLLHPPTIMKPKEEGGKYLLLAGGRRLKALRRLNISLINCRVYPYLEDERERKHIELMENTARKDLTWQESTALVEQIHENKQSIHGESRSGAKEGWGIRDTAETLGVSKSSIQDDLTLAKAMKTIPSVAKCKNKSEAKRMVEKMFTQAVSIQIAENIAKADPQKGGVELNERQKALVDSYVIGNCLEEMKSLQSASYQIVEIDWPYGQSNLASASMKLTSKEQKKDLMLGIEAEEFLQFAQSVLVEAARLVKTHGWMIVWFSPLSYATPLEMMLRNLGFRVGMPCIWYKSLVPSNASQYYLDNTYEMFYLVGGPNAKLYKRRSGGNIFQYKNPARTSVIHPTEKPIELLQELLDLVGGSNSKVLVPFAGSGATMLAAANLGMESIGFDISNKYRPSYLVRVSESLPGNYKSYKGGA